MIEILNSKQIPLSKLTANNGQIDGIPKNPRFIKNERYQKLLKSIQDNPEFLGARELIVHEYNGKYVVLCGNMRYRAAKELQFDSIPCKVIPEYFSIEQIKAIIIKDNISFGDDDFDALANEWDATELEEWGFEFPEFNSEDLEPEILEAKEDDYEMPEQMQVDVVLGDLIEIGEHRLICGDSTDSDTVAKLMNGDKADMVFTDPPYGISVVKSEMVGANFGVAKKGKYSEVIADDTTKTAQEFYQTCVALGMDKFIIWGGNYFTDFLPFSDGWLIWNKRANTDIRNTFADGEMAWCSFHTPIRIYDQLWNGMIREGEKEKRVHPTQKPIRMLSEIIEDHIKGKLIFDGFLGSGSTMVASHQLNRKCYGMELDPKYCQVIIDRMRKLDPTLVIKINGQMYNK